MKMAILMMGLPGAGKSTVLKKMTLDGFVRIDPDEIKKEHPDYDPKDPSGVHEWSKAVSEMRIFRTVAEGKNMVIDGTGTNAEKMYKRTKELQGEGYKVHVIYVKVRIATALKRNAERERTVPERLILEKAETIETACEILQDVADRVSIIFND